MILDCPVSLGELVDKLSIVKIKLRHIQDSQKRVFLQKEHDVLQEKLDSLKLEGIDNHLESLIEINSILWKIEDDIREKEHHKSFDQEFIELARSVYINNDERFRRKKKVNEQFGSDLQEVKSYRKY